MDILLSPHEGLAPYTEESWSRGIVPPRWAEAYARPIVLLANGFSALTLAKLGEILSIDEDDIADSVAEEIERQFEFVPPPLPPVRFEIAPGGLSEWRDRKGHFLIARCNGCWRFRPMYWTESESDIALAREIEASHPAIPFLERQVASFEGGEFAGCFCGGCEHQTHRPSYGDKEFWRDMDRSREWHEEEELRERERRERARRKTA